MLCIMYEYTKEEKRSWRKACQVTVQKLLYVLVVCATAVRGAYFFTKVNSSLHPGVFFSFLLFLRKVFSFDSLLLQMLLYVANSLWSAYFAVILMT